MSLHTLHLRVTRDWSQLRNLWPSCVCREVQGVRKSFFPLLIRVFKGKKKPGRLQIKEVFKNSICVLFLAPYFQMKLTELEARTPRPEGLRSPLFPELWNCSSFNPYWPPAHFSFPLKLSQCQQRRHRWNLKPDILHQHPSSTFTLFHLVNPSLSLFFFKHS